MSDNFLGKGWKFPTKINNKGGFSYSAGVVDIEEAIWIILGTAKGERVMMSSEFGCGIHNLVFEPLNPATIGDIKYHVTEALLRWESRIDVLGVEAESSNGNPNLVLVRIDYRVLANNNYYNMVYPFYFREGAGSR